MTHERSNVWRYGVCGLLLCATMLLYMDRLTISVLATRICNEYGFTNEEYGALDTGLSYAFAAGAFFFGFVVDKIGPRFLYPFVLMAWSAAGIATAYSAAIGAAIWPHAETKEQVYYGFMGCRVALGFFESGHWPCALVTTQVIMSRADRSLGNSILQSGAAIGSVVTPIIVLALKTDDPGGWQPPFKAIGCLGVLWIIPWFFMIRSEDVKHRIGDEDTSLADDDKTPKLWSAEFFRMLAVLSVIVICINLPWQYFRVWLPMFLEKSHGYEDSAAWFTSMYYVSADIGCIGVGLLVKFITGRKWEVHQARVVTFTACAAMVLLAVVVACMPSANAKENGFFSTPSLILLGMLLVVAAGTLGLYPNYYSFTQELSRKHQGKVSGVLGTIAWIGSGTMQPLVGRISDETQSFSASIAFVGCLPALACVVLWLVWPARRDVAPSPAPESVTGIKEVSDQPREASA